MQRVVVPFSDLASGERALDALLRAPREPHLEVELVAMVEALRPGKVMAFVSQARAAADVRRAAEHWLSVLGARLDAAGVPWRGRVAPGSPAATLRRLGTRTDLARIVVATPRNAWWRRRSRQAALHAALRPVVVVS